ncbi:MAG TPA: hypothetical protein VM008_09725 [Phycisphaerae bacterium]|nr:hypothetical protein [Phycisphaerae bacterium]
MKSETQIDPDQEREIKRRRIQNFPMILRKADEDLVAVETFDWKIRDFVSSTLKTPIAIPTPVNTKAAMDTDPTTGAVFLKFCMFPPVDFGGLNL